jgi:dTDP-4-amino-4,6-dideoxygalactose transaminase
VNYPKDIDLPLLHANIFEQLNDVVQKVTASGIYIGGSEVKEFELAFGKYVNGSCVGVGTGTDALMIALLALGIGSGDEVLVPSFSYFASVECISAVGATPVLVDIDPYTFTLNVNDCISKVNSNTKAIIPVHLYGVSANMSEIMDFARGYNLKVVEDCAQAAGTQCLVGNTWQHVGTIGDFGAFSFFPTKNLGAIGDGGAIISKNSKLLEKARQIAQHGQSAKYVHERIGMNSRLDAIQAAVLNLKLPLLDRWNNMRVKIVERYGSRLQNEPKIQLPVVPGYSSHVFHQFTIVINTMDRDSLLRTLNEKGVPARLYYPKAIHQQPAFKDYQVHLPITEDIQSRMISLPIHPYLTFEQCDFICDTLLHLINK